MSISNSDDFYLSDIHVENENNLKDEVSQIYKTRIEFSFPFLINEKNIINSENDILFDEDGDLIIQRESKSNKLLNKQVVYIDHHRQTKLDDVGLQLWRATFYLTDYLMYLNLIEDKLHSFSNQIIVDLGTGLGFTSFICTLFNPKRVYSTDLKRCLELAEKNWISNKSIFDEISNKNIDCIYFKEIDWFNHENLFKSNSSHHKFLLNEEDFDFIREASIFIAADVIYDDSITSGLMNTLYKLMTSGKHTKKICIISNEQRINFNTEYLTSTDTAYDYFKECLNDLNGYIDEENKYKFEIENVKFDDDLPKYVINYKRNNYLYIWIIKCYPI
jgi:predicted nicotinamide N-methyase